MRQEIKTIDGGTEIHLAGRFTFQDHDAFGGIVALIKDPATKRCVIDLSGLEFADSAALGMLLVARDAANGHGVALALRGARGKVKDILKVANFSSLFAMES